MEPSIDLTPEERHLWNTCCIPSSRSSLRESALPSLFCLLLAGGVLALSIREREPLFLLVPYIGYVIYVVRRLRRVQPIVNQLGTIMERYEQKIAELKRQLDEKH